jgi:hypothetical protein
LPGNAGNRRSAPVPVKKFAHGTCGTVLDGPVVAPALPDRDELSCKKQGGRFTFIMPNVVRAWILLSALLCGAGWILSAFHQLNRAGYLVVFVFAAVAAGWCCRNARCFSRETLRRALRKCLHRFKRLAPLLFLALALMSLVAGALYAAANWDSNAYRVPRVLHWLGQEQWHWIRTYNARMNIVDCGFEWLSAPLILFTRTDRWIFLINWVSYLMLPGLIFRVFTRLAVRPRVAWWWMWLLPTGWCFALQAGSVINDGFAAVYALAAVDFALQARASKRLTDFWLSLLAAALVTGAKQTSIPLALLWVIAAWPAAPLALTRPAKTLVVVLLGLLVSALPVTFFNLKYYGTWFPFDAAGTTLSAGKSFQLGSPFWAFIGNAFCLPVQNLLPPFFPYAGSWNETMQRFLQTPLGAHFASFESFGLVSSGVSESSAGIGLGICVLILVSLVAARRCRRPAPTGGCAGDRGRDWTLWMLWVTPWALLLLFMTKVGTGQNARQLAPYYVFLFPLLLTRSGHAGLVRQRWWQGLALGVMLFTGALVVLAPSRPLFPARMIIGRLQAGYPHSKIFSQAWFYVSRPSPLERRNHFHKLLPPQETVVGYATLFEADEPGLWLPYGQRRVVRVLADDTPEQLQSSGVHYVLVDNWFLKLKNQTIEQWAGQYHGDLVDQLEFELRPGQMERDYLVHLTPGPEGGGNPRLEKPDVQLQ